MSQAYAKFKTEKCLRNGKDLVWQDGVNKGGRDKVQRGEEGQVL